MKSWKKSPLVVMALVVLIVAGVLALMFGASAQDTNTNTGVPGLSGAEFTFGIFAGSSMGNNPDALSSGSKVFNGSPYALSGYVMTMTTGAIHIWIVECSQVVKDLGYKPGDVVAILCASSQVKDLKTGDYISVFGFTVRGYLVRDDDTILPAPFSY
jgi:hypothetical protein